MSSRKQYLERNLDYLSQGAVDLKLRQLDQDEFDQQAFDDFVQQQHDERKLRQIQQSKQRRQLNKEFRRQMPKIRDDETIAGQVPEIYQLKQQISKLKQRVDNCELKVQEQNKIIKNLESENIKFKISSQFTTNYGKIDIDYIQFPKYYVIKEYFGKRTSIPKPYPDGINVEYIYQGYYGDRGQSYFDRFKVTKYNIEQKYNIHEIIKMLDDEYIIYINIDDKYSDLIIGQRPYDESCQCVYCKARKPVNYGYGASIVDRGGQCAVCNVATKSISDRLCVNCATTSQSYRECKNNIFIPSGVYSVLVCTNFGNVYNISMNETKIIEKDRKTGYSPETVDITLEPPSLKVDTISIINVKLNNLLIDMLKVNYASNYQFVKNYIEQTRNKQMV